MPYCQIRPAGPWLSVFS